MGGTPFSFQAPPRYIFGRGAKVYPKRTEGAPKLIPFFPQYTIGLQHLIFEQSLKSIRNRCLVIPRFSQNRGSLKILFIKQIIDIQSQSHMILYRVKDTGIHQPQGRIIKAIIDVSEYLIFKIPT